MTAWNTLQHSTMEPAARAEIIVYRRQMLVHCCLYYRLNTELISDHDWQARADHLATLQALHGWEAGFYDACFRDWDGSTGYHLPVDDDILTVALRLLRGGA